MSFVKSKIVHGAFVAAFAGLLCVGAGRSINAGGKKQAKSDADVFGYTDAFEDQLRKIGQISPNEFAKRYPSKAKYLQRLTWDPTTAKYYKDFNAKRPKVVKQWFYEFRMNEKEKAFFKKNGFVVSGRMASTSFAEQYYRIFSRDLPVFISSDAAMQAWHHSFDRILMEVEENYLIHSLDDLLASMANQLPAARKQYGTGVLADSITDADYFLAVGRSLLKDKAVATVFNQDARVAKTLAACKAQRAEKFELFGRPRDVDFSQFKPRGHYMKTIQLQRYFKAMMWCGRIDLRIAGGKAENGTKSSPRELGAAAILLDLLRRAKKVEQWREFDRTIQVFVGRTDSMTFDHLDGILAKAGIGSPSHFKKLDDLKNLQKDILKGKIGIQHVRGHIVWVPPFGIEKAELPRSFTLLGQKFVLDSWALAKVVCDDVIWDNVRIQRRIPSCLDVAFSVLRNDQTVPLLVQRFQDPAGRRFRDGLNYQHNLAAVRNVVDMQNRKIWDENIYNQWLNALRALSQPTTDAKYPQAMRTQAWAMKTLNTQMASWTQLRHDTILYVKQSYTAGVSCEYPAGFVEPNVEFWSRVEKMASGSAKLIAGLRFPKSLPAALIQRAEKKRQAHVKFLARFAKHAGTLKVIAGKQLAQHQLTKAETNFLKETVQKRISGSGFTRYDGWYPDLFYPNRYSAGKFDALVADVHTDVPSPIIGDPGCVLHQAVGKVDLMLIAVGSGKDRMVYAGPVLSHYEFEMPAYQRLSDGEWRNRMWNNLPPRPNWTRGYLVPNPPKKRNAPR